MAIRTVNPAGGAGFTSLAAAVADLPATFTENEIIECQGTSADTASVTFAGFDVGAFSLTVRAEAAARAGTQWSTSKYRHSGNVGFAAAFVIGSGIGLTLDGLQIENVRDMADGPRGIEATPGAATVTIQNCYIRHPSGNNDGTAILLKGTGAGGIRMRNTIVDRFARGLNCNDYRMTGFWIVYNCTLVRQGLANFALLDQDGGTKRFKNVICQDAPTNYLVGAGGTNDTAAVITEDASSPNAAFRNQTISFAGADDFALSIAAIPALDAGVDLSADATWPFNDDITGGLRASPWDIGAHEYALAAEAFEDAVTEGGTAGDAIAGIAIGKESATEGGKAGDLFATVQRGTPDFSDAGRAGDLFAGIVRRHGLLTEGARAGDRMHSPFVLLTGGVDILRIEAFAIVQGELSISPGVAARLNSGPLIEARLL